MISVLSADLKFILVVTVLGIIATFIISSWHNEKIYNREKEERLVKQNNQPKTEQKSSDVIDTLDWMLQRGIITPQEHAKLVGKCLPFLQ